VQGVREEGAGEVIRNQERESGRMLEQIAR